MIELIAFLVGAGFSLLVYYRSIRPLDAPPLKKAAYFFFSFIGITGMVFLFGIMASFVLHEKR